MNIDLDKILANIEHVFINEDTYGFDKHIWEFKQNDKYIGDSVVFTMAENTNPPTFYNVISPYDEISKRAPQHALVFRGGELVLETNYTDYAAMRTGAMDAIILKTLEVPTLEDKKIIMFGKGKTAQWSKKFLLHYYSRLPEITIVDSKTPRSSYDIGHFDFIICHTNTKEFLLTLEDRSKIKHGAIIINYISSAVNTEIDPSFFNYDSANIVIDWMPNLSRAPEIKADSRMIQLKTLLKKEKTLDKTKDYTIMRLLGTPLQNLAVLQTLISDK